MKLKLFVPLVAAVAAAAATPALIAHSAPKPQVTAATVTQASHGHAPKKTYRYVGVVYSVYDGDTFKISIDGWPAPYNPVGVRLNGIDTPESRMPPAKAACEVVQGKAASKFVKANLKVGQKVTVLWTEGEHDKYGRLLSTVILPDGRDLAKTMIKNGYARAYDGGTKQPWC